MIRATVLRAVAFGLVVSVLAGAAAFVLLQGESPPDEEALGEALRTRAAAMARIAAESGGTVAVRRQESPDADDDAAPATTVKAPAPPAPPEGYAFPTFHEMAARRMAPTPAVEKPDTDAGPDWLKTPAARHRLAEQAAAAGREWAFGWVRRADGVAQPEAERALRGAGAFVVGTAGDLLRARLPADADRIAAIARLPEVAGVGAAPREAKVPPQLVAEAIERPFGDRAPVFVTLMADDADGRWRRAIEDMGAQAGWFDADTRAYAVAMPYDILDDLADADFVLAVEPVGAVRPALHAAGPAMGVDALRTRDAATGLFSGIGGASVPVGVMDTGLNISHLDIASNRRSVCGANFEPLATPRQEDQTLWLDSIGHGTHVTGILAGNGAVDPRRAGMAPLVRDIRFAKAVTSFGRGSAIGWSRAQDWLSRPTACNRQPAVKPLVLNSSLGVTGTRWEARTVVERKVDAVVWRARQLYAIAAGNLAGGGLTSYAAAKNTLAVGAAQNNGKIADFSSRGPTADGRLFPNVVGTGVGISAPRGRGSEREYAIFSGTSMSSPAVAGVAALAMDAVPALREKPAALRALLMASAVKPDAYFERRDVPWLLTAGRGRFRLDNGDGPGALQNIYGLGNVSARTSVLGRDAEDGWIGGAAAMTVEAGSFGYQDIVVPAGASRLDVVLTWDEPAAETITNSVLHDLDLWLDRGATCAPDAGACGDRASRSRIDNVEWVILPNPQPGAYRLKAVPHRVFGTPPRAGIAWTVIRGPSTPTLAVAADQEVVDADAGRAFNVDLTVSVNGYVATGTTLRVDCRSPAGGSACSMVEFIVPHASSASREDGLSRPLTGESGESIGVGEVGAGEQQRLRLRFKARGEAENFRLHFTASAWNGTAGATSVEVRVGDSANAAPGPVERPPNDDFAAATLLTGERGAAAPAHVLLATEEPGEPALQDESETRPRSVWYRWNAPATGLAQFTIAQAEPGDLSDDVALDLYRGDALVSLTRLASPKVGGGMAFFAEAGESYLVRLSIRSNVVPDPGEDEPPRGGTAPVRLRWAPGGTPVNDDFAQAVALGDGAAIEGNNQGATLEEGELVGEDFALATLVHDGIAASVWYRWTAPKTADWRFEVNRRHLRVLAFVGDDVATARLVSGAARQQATFPARQGDEYHIAVVAENALYGGTDFRLSWAEGARPGSPHDDFAHAELVAGPLHWSRFDVNSATVEPGEPAETGVRTAWWSWEAPADGEFTWNAGTRYQKTFGFSGFEFTFPENFAMRFAAFTGGSLATLTPLAVRGTDDWTDTEFTFDAVAGERYWFSIGLPRDAALAAVETDIDVHFRWGPTPANDSLAQAAALEGASGAVGGSNEFATVELGEKTGAHGDSSLWWTWQPAAGDTWYRFALETGRGVLTVYKMTGAGFEGLELVAVSHDPVGPHEAIFQAEQGARYVIRLGALYQDVDEGQGGARGDFEIRWEVNGPPVWLLYAGQATGGVPNDDGVPLDLPQVFDGAFNADGAALYANTAEGLRVFQRDAATGALTWAQTLDPVGPRPDALLWDQDSRSLITGSCDGWHTFAAGADADGAPTLAHAGAMGGVAPCASSWDGFSPHPGRMTFLTPGRAFVSLVQAGRAIETHALDEQRASLALVDSFGDFDFQHAAAHGDGVHVYAATDDQLFVLRRDEAGALRVSIALGDGDGEFGAEIQGMTSLRMLAVDNSGEHLFAFAEQGLRTLAFDLREDPSRPRFMGGVRVQAGPSYVYTQPNADYDECLSAQVRNTTPAVDVFCTLFAYTVALRPDGSLRQTDYVRPARRDRMGTLIPNYAPIGDIDPSWQVGLASPDGKHIYAIYGLDKVTIFERFESH